VHEDDPAFSRPTKPIGRYLSREDAVVMIEHGQRFEDRGERGWRRVVPSPEPLEIIDAPAVEALVGQGYVVVANGGGGIPVVRDPDGRLRGVEAVIDKDLGATLLANAVAADRLVIATDVETAVIGFGTDHAEPIGEVAVSRLRRHASDGEFASGSMGPKVEAICRFVEQTGRIGVITALDRIVAGVRGEAGTIVTPDPT
jgi:carbamate kinase